MEHLTQKDEVKVILFNGMNGKTTQETIKRKNGNFIEDIRSLMFDDFMKEFPEQEGYGRTFGLTPYLIVKELTDNKSPNLMFPLKGEYNDVIIYNDVVGRMRDGWRTELTTYSDLLIGSLILIHLEGYDEDDMGVYGDLILDEQKVVEVSGVIEEMEE